jgi:hypothetical protein
LAPTLFTTSKGDGEMALNKDQEKYITGAVDPMRRRAQQVESQNLQQHNDALGRRAAQLGGGPSGAFIKQESLARDASAKRLADANEGINAQEAGLRFQAGEADVGRQFQTSERVGSQKFASGESALQRKFLTGERLGQEKFATGERLGAQEFATGERLGSQEHQTLLSDKQIQAAYDSQVMAIEAAAAEGKLNRAQADKQLAETKRQFNEETAFNKKMAGLDALLKAGESSLSWEAVHAIFTEMGMEIPDVTALRAQAPSAKKTPSSFSDLKD